MSPQFADLNGDGKHDLLVGCFQGYAHYLKGTGGGNYETETWLSDVDGDDVHMGQYWGIKERKWMYINQVEGVADNNILVYPKLIDWDNDGDLDLVMGGRRGNIGLRINEGTVTEPQFSTTQKFLKASGDFISMKSQVSIELADMDNDDLFDLVCATSRGEITWYQNTGTKESPVFSESKTIAGPGPGAPASYLCVTSMDYNGDGKKDLLVGAKDDTRKAGYWVYMQKETGQTGL